MNGMSAIDPYKYTGPININYIPGPADGPPSVEIETEHYVLRPALNTPSIVAFYENEIPYEAATDRQYGLTAENAFTATRDRVALYARRWEQRDFFAPFIVYLKGTDYPLAHAGLMHGIQEGASDFELIMRKDTSGRPVAIGDLSRMARTSSLDQADIKFPSDYDTADTLSFPLKVDDSATRFEIAVETTYALVQGWALVLAHNDQKVTNRSSKELEKFTFTSIEATVPKEDNVLCRIFEHMLERSGTNSRDSYESKQGVSTRAHYFTSITEMRNMRRAISPDDSNTATPLLSPEALRPLEGEFVPDMDGFPMDGLPAAVGDGHSTDSSRNDVFDMEF